MSQAKQTPTKQYLLSVYHDWNAPMPADDEMQRAIRQVDELNAELQESGAWVFAAGLCAPDTATVMRADGADVITTDGPFAETKEQLGGFWIIRAADLDEALAWGRKATVACMNAVEVRPFQDDTSDEVR